MLITRTDFRNKLPFEQLDFILTQFVNNDRFKGNMSDVDVIKALFGEGNAPMNDITGSVIIEILRKLCKDEYLNSWTTTNNTFLYALTFEGRFFYNDGKGGYCQADLEKKKESQRIEEIQARQISLQKNTVLLTGLAAVATFAMAPYYILEIKKSYCFLFAFLSVFFVSSSVYLLRELYLLYKRK